MAGYVRILSASALEEGIPRVVWFRQREVMVVRVGSSVHAMENACPHLAAALSAGQILDGAIVCARHGWRIRLSDGHCLERPHRPHASYQVRLEGDEVLLAV